MKTSLTLLLALSLPACSLTGMPAPHLPVSLDYCMVSVSSEFRTDTFWDLSASIRLEGGPLHEAVQYDLSLKEAPSVNKPRAVYRSALLLREEASPCLFAQPLSVTLELGENRYALTLPPSRFPGKTAPGGMEVLVGHKEVRVLWWGPKTSGGREAPRGSASVRTPRVLQVFPLR